MTNSYSINFRCQETNCTGAEIEEVTCGIMKFSEVSTIDSSDVYGVSCDYNSHSHTSGEVDRYVCKECGEEIATDSLQLFKYLASNGMLISNDAEQE